MITEEEAKKMATNLTTTTIKTKIKELDIKRRFKQFSECPKVDTLIEDTELLNEMEIALRDPNNEFTKKIMANFKELTVAQVAKSITGLRYRAKWVRVWRFLTSWKLLAGFFAFVVLVVSGVLMYSKYQHVRVK